MNIIKHNGCLLLLLLMFFSYGAFADNAKLELTLSPAEDDSYQIVTTTDGVLHAWENSSAEYSVTLKDSVVNDTVIITLMKDGTIISSDTTNIGNSIKKDSLAIGEYKVIAELAVLYTDSTYYKESMEASFRLWEKPKVKVDLSKTDSIIWDNTPNPLLVDVTKGDWSYSWYVNGELVSNGAQGPLTWELATDSLSEQKTLTLQADCKAPDGETVWFSDTISQSLTVWRYPTITLKESEEMYYGYEKELAPTITGGDTQWKVKWLDGDQIVSNSLSYQPKATSSIKHQTKYIFLASDRPQGMSEALAYKAELPCTVTFWPEPNVEVMSGTKNKVVLFDEEKYTFSLITKGHEKDKWSFLWTKDSTELKEEKDPSYQFTGESLNSDGETTSVIKVTATLTDPGLDGVSPDEVKSTFTFTTTVWPKPLLTQQIDFDGQSYKSSEIDVCAKDAGEKLTLKALTLGGDKKAWSYTWTHNSTPVLFFDPLLVFAIPENSNREDQITHLFKVEATNKPENIVSPKMLNANFTVRVWPRPVLDFPADTNLTVVAGDIISISQMAHGGYAQGWKYECSVNDGPSQPLTEYIFKNDTDEIQDVSLKIHIVNKDPNNSGKTWLDSLVTVYAKVYPKPNVEVTGLDTDIAYYYGDSVTINAHHPEGYHYGTWEYVLKCGNDIIPDENPADGIDYVGVIASSSNEYEQYQYKLSVSCKTDDGNILFSHTYSSTIIAYKKHTCRKEHEKPIEAYDGEPYSLKVARSGGAPKYWKFQWYDEQDHQLSATDSIFSKTVQLKNSLPRKVKYHVDCTYQPPQAKPITTTLNWTVTEYAAIVEGQKEVEPLDMVRQDDSVVLSIISPQYGNPNGWHYQWYVGQDTIQDTMGDEYVSDESVQKQRVVFEQPISYGDKEKLISTVTYRLKCWNMSPDGKTRWGQEQNIDYTFTVHRRPEQPTLVRKGGSSNTSGIYVVKNFGLTDSELEELEYTIEFGDQVGVLQTDTTLRYFRYTGSPKDVWARSRWDYSDGFLCYSDKAFLNNEQKEEASGILHVEGNRFFIELDEPAAAVVTLYEYDGTIARTYSYPEQMSFDEELDLSGLKKGVCVMRFSIGDIVESYKTIVK